MLQIRHKWLAVAGASSVALAIFAVARIEAGYDIEIVSATPMYVSERDARCEYHCGPPIARPIQELQPGERLAVVSDAYGKDYWAFRVRTAAGREGWVVYQGNHFRILKPDA